MADFEQDAADLLARLVRFRTVNPPGDERDCQAHLAGVLRDAGLEVELLGRTEERPNLVARLRGAADGQTGGTEGAVWLCSEHPDKVRCDYVINEGAGTVMPFDGVPVYGVCVAEKGVFRFTITTRGAAGHASMPGVGDNALLKMAPLLQAMAERRPGLDVTDAPRELLRALELDGDGEPAAS